MMLICLFFFFFICILFLGRTNEFRTLNVTSFLKADPVSPPQWPPQLFRVSFFSNGGGRGAALRWHSCVVTLSTHPHPKCLRMAFPELIGYFKVKLLLELRGPVLTSLRNIRKGNFFFKWNNHSEVLWSKYYLYGLISSHSSPLMCWRTWAGFLSLR